MLESDVFVRMPWVCNTQMCEYVSMAKSCQQSIFKYECVYKGRPLERV